MAQLDLTFEKEKDTSGTGKFKETTEGEGRKAVGTIYVTKDALAKIGNPSNLKVTVEADNG